MQTFDIHPQYISCISLVYFPVALFFLASLHKSSQSIWSHAYYKYINITLMSFCASLCISCAEENASVVISPGTYPKLANYLSSGMYADTRPPVLWTGKTDCGRVFICLDGLKHFFFNSYVSRSPVRRTAQSALHVMLLSYYRYRHVCIS